MKLTVLSTLIGSVISSTYVPNSLIKEGYSLLFSNGYFNAKILSTGINDMKGDFLGLGKYGSNVLTGNGISLEKRVGMYFIIILCLPIFHLKI